MDSGLDYSTGETGLLPSLDLLFGPLLVGD